VVEFYCWRKLEVNSVVKETNFNYSWTLLIRTRYQELKTISLDLAFIH